ncbi:MAG: hypothetical protein J5761_05260 [Paludibacteraceae bacterium]|nr:hypothetical protein [Paludibacteraceae bacterium]
MQKSNNMPSRLYFLSKGCRQVPPEECHGIIRWGHPDGYFLNAYGQKVTHNYSPSSLIYRPNMHGRYPKLRECVRECHILMAITFHGPRPDEAEIGVTKKRSSYFCHHLIPDRLNYRPANLLCWLTRAEHNEADRRQRALREAVDGGDLYGIPYERLRWLQDPRVTSREDFECELAKIREQGFHHYDLEKQLEYEMSHHCEV